MEFEQKRDEIEIHHQQEELRLQHHLLQQQQEQDLYFKLRQQKDEMSLRQQQRALENEGEKSEANEEQTHMEIELTNRSSRVSRSRADDLESIGSRHKLERTAGWADSLEQRSGTILPLSPNS